MLTFGCELLASYLYNSRDTIKFLTLIKHFNLQWNFFYFFKASRKVLSDNWYCINMIISTMKFFHRLTFRPSESHWLIKFIRLSIIISRSSMVWSRWHIRSLSDIKISFPIVSVLAKVFPITNQLRSHKIFTSRWKLMDSINDHLSPYAIK